MNVEILPGSCLADVHFNSETRRTVFSSLLFLPKAQMDEDRGERT